MEVKSWNSNMLLVAITFACFSQLCASSVSDSSLEDLSERLLSKDTNNAAKFVTVNRQSKKRPSVDDSSPQPLLSVNSKAYNIPSISKLVAMYDNYEPNVTVPEVETPPELNEESAFMDEVIKTDVMKELKTWLQKNNFISLSMNDAEFKKWVHEFWFTEYSRGKKILGSSAFEHVFLGELKNGEVSGFHNWVFFADQENKKKADYDGWKKYTELKDKGELLKFSFKWLNVRKPVGAMFIGTSPELEMALYTACFFARPNTSCKLRLNGNPVSLKIYDFSYKGKKYIGTAYPEI